MLFIRQALGVTLQSVWYGLILLAGVEPPSHVTGIYSRLATINHIVISQISMIKSAQMTSTECSSQPREYLLASSIISEVPPLTVVTYNLLSNKYALSGCALFCVPPYILLILESRFIVRGVPMLQGARLLQPGVPLVGLQGAVPVEGASQL